MERFDFSNTPINEATLSKDPKAATAFMLLQAMVADTQAHALPMAMISFDVGTSGLSGPDICSYFYDNYELEQLEVMYAMAVGKGPKIEMEHYANPDDMLTRKNELDSHEK